MTGSSNHPGIARRAIALAMAVVVAFLGVAVFSALHHHQGANKRCSLNGFDQFASAGAEQPVVLQVSGVFEWQEPSQPVPLEAVSTSSSLHLRGPPAAL